jgi:transposase-like protein
MEEIMTKGKNTYSPEQKVKMILEGLTYPDGIGAYCRKSGISDVLFYKWKKQLIDNAKVIFKPKQKENALEIRLKEQIIKKDSIISELASENINLKKKNGILE